VRLSPRAVLVDGRVDEDALAALEPKRVAAFPGNTICEGTFELPAGAYVVFCNLLDEDATPAVSHFAEGMVTPLRVA
jgi:hypothetical protein